MTLAFECNNIVPFYRPIVTHIDQQNFDAVVAESESQSIYLWYLTPVLSCNLWHSEFQADTWHIIIHQRCTDESEVRQVVFDETLNGTRQEAMQVVEAFAGIDTPCWINHELGLGVWLYCWYDSIAGEWIVPKAPITDE